MTSELADSPLAALLDALSRLDVEAAVTLLTPDGRLATADGRQAAGRQDVHDLLGHFFADLRSASYQVIGVWHQDNVWFAEILANYEMRDWLRLEGLPRAFVVRTDAGGIRDVRVYGAHERRLTDQRTPDDPYRIGGHVVLPL